MLIPMYFAEFGFLAIEYLVKVCFSYIVLDYVFAGVESLAVFEMDV